MLRSSPSEKENKNYLPKADLSEEELSIPQSQEKDPTRFGDWEKNGRCIDF
jgi:hypothetical protein